MFKKELKNKAGKVSIHSAFWLKVYHKKNFKLKLKLKKLLSISHL